MPTLTINFRKRTAVAAVLIAILAYIYNQPELLPQVLGEETYSKLANASSDVSKMTRYVYPDECFSAPFLDILHLEMELWKISLVPFGVALLRACIAPYPQERVLHSLFSVVIGYGVSQLLGCMQAAATGIFLWLFIRTLGLFKINYFLLIIGMLSTYTSDKSGKPLTLASITSYVMISWTALLMIFRLCKGIPCVKDFAKKVIQEEAEDLQVNSSMCKFFYWISNKATMIFVLYLMFAHVFNESHWQTCVVEPEDKLKAWRHRNKINFWLGAGMVLLLTLATYKDLSKELEKKNVIPKKYKQQDKSVWLDKKAKDYYLSLLFKHGLTIFCNCVGKTLLQQVQ